MKKGQNFNHPPKGKSIKIEPIRSADSIETIKSHLKGNPRNYALFTLGINTSLRPQDLLNITHGQVLDMNASEKPSLSFHRGKRAHKIMLNKMSADALLDLSAEEMKKSKKPLNPDAFLFKGLKGRLSMPALNNLVKKWCTDANVKGNYGSHTLRKTYGYHRLLYSGMELQDLMAEFNHLTRRQLLNYLGVRLHETSKIAALGANKKVGPKHYSGFNTVDIWENEIGFNTDVVKRLSEEAKKYRTIFKNANDQIVYINADGIIEEINKAVDIFGNSREEIIGRHFFDFGYLSAEDMDRIVGQWREKPEEDHIGTEVHEFKGYHNDGSVVFFESTIRSFKEDSKIKGYIAIIRDITDRNKLNEELLKYQNHLEEVVKKRTLDLENANAALNILLKKREEDRKKVEEKILFNVMELIRPNLGALRAGIKDRRHQMYLDIIESNLNDIISPFSHLLSSRYYNLTPAELQISNLIKYGKSTKEIAGFLNLSVNTVKFHRTNIRKKFGINKQKSNLRSYLQFIR